MIYNLYLIRHAKTEGNLQRRYIGRTNEPLCEQGILELREHIKATRYPVVDHIFVSPMIRCDQTRELIYPDNSFTVVPEFAEYNFGFFENKAYEQLKDTAEYQNWLDSGGKGLIPEGESTDAFRARCLAGLEKVLEKMDRAGIVNAALVIHGGTIMTLLEAYSPEISDFYAYQVKNCEGYHLVIDQTTWQETRKALSVSKIMK